MSARRTRILSLVAALALVALALSATAGAADPTAALIGGNCGASQAVFARWGDANQYVFTTAGGFEAGAPGWSFSGGAHTVAGNEPFTVHAASDSTSALLPAGSSVTSPATCFGLLTPNIRFFARSVGAASATIHVRVVATGLLGVLTVLDGGSATVGATWAPTPVFATTLSQLNTLVGAKTIEIEITATSGSAQVDDLYIDPFVSH